MKDGKVEMNYCDFIDLIEEKEESDRDSVELNEILDCIFEEANLSYDKKSLYFNNNALEGYLKIKESHRYNKRLKELQEQEKEGDE